MAAMIGNNLIYIGFVWRLHFSFLIKSFIFNSSRKFDGFCVFSGFFNLSWLFGADFSAGFPNNCICGGGGDGGIFPNNGFSGCGGGGGGFNVGGDVATAWADLVVASSRAVCSISIACLISSIFFSLLSHMCPNTKSAISPGSQFPNLKHVRQTLTCLARVVCNISLASSNAAFSSWFLIGAMSDFFVDFADFISSCSSVSSWDTLCPLPCFPNDNFSGLLLGFFFTAFLGWTELSSTFPSFALPLEIKRGKIHYSKKKTSFLDCFVRVSFKMALFHIWHRQI